MENKEKDFNLDSGYLWILALLTLFAAMSFKGDENMNDTITAD